MTNRIGALVLAVGCALAIGGCGDDDDGGDDNQSSAGRGGGGAGRSSGAGSGNAGSGSGDISAEDALAGACEMMETMGMSATDCEGIDEYTECFLDMCGGQNCLETACQDYVDCIEGAADPCENDCTQSSACLNCYTSQADCVGNNCLRLIMCGEIMAGGACDQLDDCCAEQPDQMRMFCEQLAAGARIGGDMACEMAMDAFCM